VATLDHVQVAAPPGCEAAARAFYGELLGAPGIRRFYTSDPWGNRIELLER
jgi:catechol 2,3-dioxygenase-like lactoylglutathione lyase family enzyme